MKTKIQDLAAYLEFANPHHIVEDAEILRDYGTSVLISFMRFPQSGYGKPEDYEWRTIIGLVTMRDGKPIRMQRLEVK